jgi:signal transduction histidine kinase
MLGRLLRRTEGIRFRIIGLVLISIIPVLAAFSWQANEARHRSHSDASLDTQRLSRLTAEREAASVDEARLLLAHTASEQADSLSDPTACQGILSRVKNQLPFVTNVFTIDGSGTVTCTVDPKVAGVDLSGRSVLTNARSSNGFASSLEAPGPLVPSEQLIGVLPVSGNPEVAMLGVTLQLGATLPSFVTSLGLPARSETALLDSHARVISAAPNSAELGRVVPMQEVVDHVTAGGVEGSAEAKGADGITRLYSYSDVGGTGESVFALVGIPTDVAFAAGNRELRASLIAAGLVTVIAVALALLIAELSVSRPVRTIVATVRRLGSGELSARSAMRGGGELQEVAGAIDEMADSVQARERTIRDAAAERERLMGELLDAQEDERRKVAADIHDDTIQTMIAAGMEIQLLRVELDDEARTGRFRHVEGAISTAVAGLRNLIFELEPPESSTEALEDNISQYLEHALGSTPLDTQVIVHGDGDLEGPQRQVLFRNLREAALNAARHGEAHELLVGVDVLDDGVMVTVTDDGKGMKPGEERKPGHHGMRVMRERAEALGGWFRLDRPNRGTTVAFWLPQRAGAE